MIFWGPSFPCGKDGTPDPQKRHQRGDFDFPPLDSPLKRPKGRGCGPYPLETHPGTEPFGRYGVSPKGHHTAGKQPGERSRGRGPAGPLPWSLREGGQGERESKLSPPDAFWGFGGLFCTKEAPRTVSVKGNTPPSKLEKSNRISIEYKRGDFHVRYPHGPH